MILPTKNIKMKYSLINCGASILSKLDGVSTISSIWEKSKNEEALINYEKFILTLDFLYMINAIEYKDGLIERCKK